MKTQKYGTIAWWREKYVYEENTRINTALEKGRKEAKLEDAKKMKEKKIPIETIIEITELSKEEIEKL